MMPEQLWLNSQTRWSQTEFQLSKKSLGFEQRSAKHTTVPIILKVDFRSDHKICLFPIYRSMSPSGPSFGERIQANSASLHLRARFIGRRFQFTGFFTLYISLWKYLILQQWYACVNRRKVYHTDWVSFYHRVIMNENISMDDDQNLAAGDINCILWFLSWKHWVFWGFDVMLGRNRRHLLLLDQWSSWQLGVSDEVGSREYMWGLR